MKKAQTFILREIAGETILVPTGKTALQFNGIITFTETAAFIWNHLEEASCLERLVEMLKMEYEIDEAEAFADTQEFVDQLLSAKMVDYTDPEKKW